LGKFSKVAFWPYASGPMVNMPMPCPQPSGVVANLELGERSEVWEQSPQWDTGAEPLIRGRSSWSWKLLFFWISWERDHFSPHLKIS